VPSDPAVIFIAPTQIKTCPRQEGGEYSLRAASVAAKKAALSIPVMKKQTNTGRKLLTIEMARYKKHAVELVKEALCFDILPHRKLMKVQTFGFWWGMNIVCV